MPGSPRKERGESPVGITGTQKARPTRRGSRPGRDKLRPALHSHATEGPARNSARPVPTVCLAPRLRAQEVFMERTILSATLSTLLGVSTLGGLAFVWPAPAPPAPSPKSESGWQLLNPVTYENITLFPVVASYNQDTSPFLTLDEGLSTGDVIVSEQGATGLVRNRDGRPMPAPQYNTGSSVNQLVLINRGKRPVLLLAGELVSGGKQDRIIAKDRIVAPGADPLPLDVFCVEHGRWTGSSSQFAASKTIVHPSVREKAAVDQEQTEVWSAVRGGTTASAPPASASESRAVVSQNELSAVMRTEAPTQSYE